MWSARSAEARSSAARAPSRPAGDRSTAVVARGVTSRPAARRPRPWRCCSGASSRCTAPSRCAARGMPNTTELASSCANVRAPARRMRQQPAGAVVAHARERDADAARRPRRRRSRRRARRRTGRWTAGGSGSSISRPRRPSRRCDLPRRDIDAAGQRRGAVRRESPRAAGTSASSQVANPAVKLGWMCWTSRMGGRDRRQRAEQRGERGRSARSRRRCPPRRPARPIARRRRPRDAPAAAARRPARRRRCARGGAAARSASCVPARGLGQRVDGAGGEGRHGPGGADAVDQPGEDEDRRRRLGHDAGDAVLAAAAGQVEVHRHDVRALARDRGHRARRRRTPRPPRRCPRPPAGRGRGGRAASAESSTRTSRSGAAVIPIRPAAAAPRRAARRRRSPA